MGMFNTILLAIILAAFSFVLQKIHKKLSWIVFTLFNIFLLYTAYTLYRSGSFYETVRLGFPVVKGFALQLSLKFSNIGFLFFAVSGIVTTVISLFSLSYNDKKHATAISPLWILLVGANIGIFFANDWITLLVFWEVMGLSSFFIISHGKPESAKAGLYYLVLSLIGTSALIFSILLIYNYAGTLVISESLTKITALWAGDFSIPTLITILLTVTFFTKSAVFPFYMWPAKAHAEAPDDFSAFLSGIMIKYGVFGQIAFVMPVFSGYIGLNVNGVPFMLVILGVIGAATAVLGTLYGIRQNDMKRLMAYSTVGHIGYIFTAMSVNTSFGIAAALFHTFNHMVFKSAIFLSMASVKYQTGERNMHKLGGMAYKMPVAFFTFLISIIAAAGIPPMSGFGSKWMMFQSLFDVKFLLLAIPIFFASTGAFMYLFRGLHSIYLGQLSERFKDIKAAPFLQSAAMIILMLMVMAAGFLPGLVLLPVNQVIESLGYKPLEVTMYAARGVTANINFTIAGAAFVGAFFIVMVFFLLGKKRNVIKDPLDRYTSAEIPEQWGLTPDKYHFGLRFYDYFEDMVNPALHKTSVDNFFQRVAYEINRFGGVVSRLLKNPATAVFLTVTAMIILFIIGWFNL
jgi:NADH-quinone oxidoreductase subunit M